jgi:hypothetical protein
MGTDEPLVNYLSSRFRSMVGTPEDAALTVKGAVEAF